ncbi:signal peptide peptidase SppA [Sulfurimonas sp. MAG313]|nr:signal peptide peptidase SppA [Sulfurimonas sp. MAG313]MDF1879895.1 signal peptide peptidase SppA [Sulfurimonas sp. MAG313]
MNAIKSFFSPFLAIMGFIQNHFKAMLFLLLVFFLFSPSEEELKPANLAQIKLQGVIMDASVVVQQLETARKDDAIKGVLFIVNSPGGAVPPSIEIMQAIKRLKEKKPVVAYAAGTIASGSYYASIYANKIYANPGSMVGSIGVIMQGANYAKLAQKIGISSQTIKAGKFKEVGTGSREWTPDEKAELEKVINDTYDLFVNDVATARKLDPKNHTEFADAHIFTASQAKKVGLIDELGVGFDAKKALIKLSKVDEAIWQKEDKIDSFMRRLSGETASFMGAYFSNLTMR